MTVKKAKSTSSQSPRVMDIAKPGTLKNSTAGSRPVIVTNRVIVQDPMVKSDDDKDDSGATRIPVTQKEKLVIKPLSEPDEGLLSIPLDPTISEPDEIEVEKPVEIKFEETTRTTLSDPVPKEEKKIEPKPEPKPEVKSEEKPEATNVVQEPPKQEPSVPDSPNEPEKSDDITENGDQSDAAKLGAKEKADAKAQQEIEELIDNKTYFLPIESAEHRRSRIVVIVGFILIVVLALVWLNVAMDAGFIEIPSVRPLTHYFKT